MYSSARGVWQGFSKNLLLGLQSAAPRKRGWRTALLPWSYASVFVMPFALLLSRRYRRLALLPVLWLALERVAASIYLRRPLTEAVTTPLAAWGVMVMTINAWFRALLKRPVRWKGRDYPIGAQVRRSI